MRLSAFILMIATTPAVAASQASEPPFKASGAFLAMSVPDAAASARWYREKLGLKVILEPPATNEVKAIIMEGGGLLLELIQHSQAKPLGTLAPGASGGPLVHGYFKAGFMVDDFDRTLAALKARGVEIAYGPYPKTPTMRANAIIKDNTGNLIQLFGK
jgi:catechol 2,3-dioxygenase-like lactoylglutathione lyase family enzyme